jgi:hypothetical protein
MHHFHSLKSNKNVRIAGGDRVYFYLLIWDKNVSHRGMDFSLHCSRVHQISIQWALLDLSLDNKVTACLSLVPVLRISAVLKMPDQNVLSTYPEHGCSKLLLYVSIACTHIFISQRTAIFIHQHHCENPRAHYCTFFSPFLSLYCLVLW